MGVAATFSAECSGTGLLKSRESLAACDAGVASHIAVSRSLSAKSVAERKNERHLLQIRALCLSLRFFG